MHHRSRQGCSSCRRSHVKCDEQRPICSRCYHKNKTCEYGIQLIWPEESIAKGVSHGRGASLISHNSSSLKTGRKNSLPSLSRHGTHFLNTSTADIEGRAGSIKESAGATLQEHPPEFLAKPHSILRNPQPGQGSDYDGALMSFYDLVICSTATIEDTPESNPFRGVLIPLALESNAVLHALQAVSAKVISLRQPSYQETTLSYHSTALRGLITTIDDLEESDTSLLEACAVSTLLCWFEISCNNHRTWVNHLTGLMHLLARRGKAVTLPPFLVDYFLFHFVVDRTVLDLEHLEQAMKTYTEQNRNTEASASPCDFSQDDGNDPPALETNLESFMSSGHPSEMTVTLLQWMGSVDLHQINTYTGLSGGLLLLINKITDLECPSNSRAATVHHRIAAGIKTLLENLQQDVPPNLLASTTIQLSASAETYRLACLLYLHHKAASIRARISVRTASTNPLFSESEVSHLASQILTHLEDNPGLTKTVANRLWPIFMAGCSADDEFLRLRVLNLFQQIEKDRRFWNVAPARLMIIKIWRHRDLRVDEPMVPIRKYKKPHKKHIGHIEGSTSDWDRILEMMANFTWSLT